MISAGVKTAKSDKTVTNTYVEEHLMIGVESLAELRDNGKSVKHLVFS
jgi:AMP nucleosidase